MSDQSKDRKYFEAWFGTPLTALMEDPDAGFIVAMVAFPLLERYLRRESGSAPNQKLFQDAVLKFLPELKTARQAKEFWESYRHRLLHNVMLNGVEDWLSHETAIIEKRPKRVSDESGVVCRAGVDLTRFGGQFVVSLSDSLPSSNV